MAFGAMVKEKDSFLLIKMGRLLMTAEEEIVKKRLSTSKVRVVLTVSIGRTNNCT